MRLLRKHGISEVQRGLSAVVAAVATSGLSLNVLPADNGCKLVDLRISTCQEWKECSGSGTHRSLYLVPYDGPCIDLTEFIKKSIGGRWLMQRRNGCLEGVKGVNIEQSIWSLRFSDFVHVGRANIFVQDFAAELEDFFPGASHVWRFDPFPLKSHLDRSANGQKGLRLVKAIFGNDSRKIRLWIRHLRAAGLSEYQIAVLGEELILQTSKFYNPVKGVFLQDAIKKAVTYLHKSQAHKEVVEAFKENPWELVAADGLDEKLTLNEAEYRRGLTPMADFKLTMKKRQVGLRRSAKADAKLAKRKAAEAAHGAESDDDTDDETSEFGDESTASFEVFRPVKVWTKGDEQAIGVRPAKVDIETASFHSLRPLRPMTMEAVSPDHYERPPERDNQPETVHYNRSAVGSPGDRRECEPLRQHKYPSVQEWVVAGNSYGNLQRARDWESGSAVASMIRKVKISNQQGPEGSRTTPAESPLYTVLAGARPPVSASPAPLTRHPNNPPYHPVASPAFRPLNEPSATPEQCNAAQPYAALPMYQTRAGQLAPAESHIIQQPGQSPMYLAEANFVYRADAGGQEGALMRPVDGPEAMYSTRPDPVYVTGAGQLHGAGGSRLLITGNGAAAAPGYAVSEGRRYSPEAMSLYGGAAPQMYGADSASYYGGVHSPVYGDASNSVYQTAAGPMPSSMTRSLNGAEAIQQRTYTTRASYWADGSPMYAVRRTLNHPPSATSTYSREAAFPFGPEVNIPAWSSAELAIDKETAFWNKMNLPAQTCEGEEGQQGAEQWRRDDQQSYGSEASPSKTSGANHTELNGNTSAFKGRVSVPSRGGSLNPAEAENVSRADGKSSPATEAPSAGKIDEGTKTTSEIHNGAAKVSTSDDRTSETSF